MSFCWSLIFFLDNMLPVLCFKYPLFHLKVECMISFSRDIRRKLSEALLRVSNSLLKMKWKDLRQGIENCQ